MCERRFLTLPYTRFQPGIVTFLCRKNHAEAS
jgi:hypothetical protein